MTDETPTQPTGSGKLIWRKPLTCDVVEFGTAPDPRDLTIAALRESLEAAHRFGIANHERAARADARIAELEAALREVRKLADVNDGRTDWKRLQDAGQIARTALMPSPERDMKMAQEELSA